MSDREPVDEGDAWRIERELEVAVIEAAGAYCDYTWGDEHEPYGGELRRQAMAKAVLDLREWRGQVAVQD